MRRSGIALLVTGCLVGLAWAAPGQSQSVRPTRCIVPDSAIAAGLADFDRHHGGVGGVAAIRRHGVLLFSTAFGFADLEHRVPTSPASTKFFIASVTKTFTAAAVLRLHQDGYLDLDAPIQNYVPDFPAPPGDRPITLRALAGHLAGIRHYRDSERDANFFARHFDDAAATLEVFRSDPFIGRPGERFLYSSFGYNLIAAVTERVAGLPFPRLVEQSILAPLGLTETLFDDIRRPTPGRARGYTYWYPWFSRQQTDSVLRAPDYDYSYNLGGGSLLATAEDLAKFGESFIRPGIFDASSLDLSRTPIQVGTVRSPWSFGWQVGTDDANRVVLTSEGSDPGFQATLVVYPEQGMSATLLLNSWGKRPAVPHRIDNPVAWMVSACMGWL